MLLSYLTLKFSKRPLDKDMFVSLGKFLVVLILVLMVLVTVDKLTHFYPPKREAVMFLISGPWAWIFWLQVALGYFIPLGILVQPVVAQEGGMGDCRLCHLRGRHLLRTGRHNLPRPVPAARVLSR